MSESPAEPGGLADRLKALRGGDNLVGKQVTQKQLADALGVSSPLISSWETGAVVPPESRLRQYARYFAGAASIGTGNLPSESALDDAETRLYRRLIEELDELRSGRVREAAPGPGTGALGGRFFHFPDGRPVVIVTTIQSETLGKLDWASPAHPNYIRSLGNADTDATIEVFGHIRAENPTSYVRWVLYADLTNEMITGGHLVLLGGGNPQPGGKLDWLLRRLELPVVSMLPAGGDEEYDSVFVVRTDQDGNPSYRGTREETHQPVFLRGEDGGSRFLSDPDDQGRRFPQLEYDLACLARLENPLNGASVTICNGIFSRGTYGALRAFTDDTLRDQNEQYVYRQFDDPDHPGQLRPFWMLIYVPVMLADTITPDLNRAFHRVRISD
jgi:transcriptional regulator with XRE-family HTH domain